MKLSVITINYNNASGLQRTIESVISQGYTDMEYIVIDGGSTDRSVEIIKNNESYISKWISEKDTGIYNALNKGIKMATGDYLLFLNSGDHFYTNDVLVKNNQYLTDYDLVAFDIHVYGQGYDQIKAHPNKPKFSFLFEDTFAHQSVLIKRELFDNVGLYDETLKIVADWKFFIHAIIFHKASYLAVHEVLSTYYLDGISSGGEGSLIRDQERKNVLSNEFSFFYDDYVNAEQNKNLLNMNRFKMLQQLEQSNIGRKISSMILRILTKIV
ncbi:glycosyltransferase family 2 protein [Flavobacterium enshiense]|uniref:glycosyltransferase family 2 protein n=1 Tax=Flavobacterium enshiense TaxID=1341165 RepID=UPI00345DE046